MLSAALVLCGCSRGWVEQTETSAAVWTDADEFAAPTLLFQSKKSWNPFSSHEDRRSIRTTIQFMQKKENSIVPAASASVEIQGLLLSGPARLFGGLMMVRRLTEGKTWIHDLVFIGPDGKQQTLVSSGQRGATIQRILASPDNKKALLVYNINSEQFLIRILESIPKEGEAPPAAELIQVGGPPLIAWDPASSRVFLKGRIAALVWDGKKVPQNTVSAPGCFFPPTRLGLGVSHDGFIAVRNGSEWKIEKAAGWVPHDRIRQNVRFEEIGKNCPKEEP